MKKTFQILVFILIGIPEIFASDNYPVGGRAIGLSNAFISITDTWSTFHNQATLVGYNSLTAGFFYESRFMLDELSLAAGSMIVPAGSGTFGFSFYQFGQNSFKEHKVGLAYSRKLSKQLNAAIQLDYFSQRFPENDGATGFPTFEIGLTYKTTEHLTLGAHVFNLIKNGFKTINRLQKLPVTYRIGGHYRFSEMVLLSSEVQKTSNHPSIVKTGLEFLPAQNLAIRIGVSGRPLQYTAGIGYKVGKISTDIAFSYHSNLGFTPSVSVQFIL